MFSGGIEKQQRAVMGYLKRYITSNGNTSMGVSTKVGIGKKYTIWYFGLSRSPGNKFERQFAR